MLVGVYQPAAAAVSVVKLTAGNAAAGDLFGTSAAIDGATLVVGAPGAGTAYVFRRQGANLWPEEARLTVPGGSGQAFGHAVAVDGDTILVGAPGDSEAGAGTGSAYVFVRSGGTWSQQAKLLATDAEAGQRFGSVVDLHEDTAIIGTRVDAPAGGSAYTFLRNGGAWAEEQKLAPAAPSGGFGQSVAVDGDLALVGDPLQQVAHAFARALGVWTLDASLTPTGGTGEAFGNAVALSGATAIVGAIGENRFTGAAYAFLRQADGWQQQDRLAAGAGVAGERFAISVALAGDTAMIAALGPQTVGQSTQTFLFLFERDLDEWNEIGKELFDSGSLVATEESEFVGVSGCSAVAGTELDDQAAPDAGAAHAVLLGDCPCREPLTGLRAWWPLDEPAPRALDIEGSHDAQWFDDPTPVAGIVGQALEFDGHGDHLVVPDDPALDFGAGDDFTLDAWVKPAGLGGVAALVDKREPGGGRGYSLRLENGRPALLISDGSLAAASVVAAEPLPTGEWSFVAASVDRTVNQGLLYVNGQVAASFVPGDLAPGDLANDAPLLVATTADDELYAGAIDEVELFGRALSAAELDSLFQALSGGKCKPCAQPPPDLAAWWPLDETVGPVSADVAGPNDGQWIGTPEPANGKVGGALRITSPDDRLAVADHPSLDFAAADSFTLDAWIKPDSVDNLLAVIVSKWQPETRVGYRLFLRSGRIVFQMGDGTVAQVSYVSPNVISTTAWSLVAVTVDRAADEGRVSINGALDGTFTPSAAAPGSLANDIPLSIGGDPSEDALAGRIDEVEIYRRALGEAEIHTLYTAEERGKCKPGAAEPSAPPRQELDTGLIILGLLLLVLVLLLLTRGKPRG